MSELLALCYHAVSPRWRADISVTPARLEAQLRVLLRRGYRSAAFHDGVTARDGARTLAVWHDDGDARFRMKVSQGLRRLRETRASSPLASGWRSPAGSA